MNYDRNVLLDTIDSYVRNKVKACLAEHEVEKREYLRFADMDYNFLKIVLGISGPNIPPGRGGDPGHPTRPSSHKGGEVYRRGRNPPTE